MNHTMWFLGVCIGCPYKFRNWTPALCIFDNEFTKEWKYETGPRMPQNGKENEVRE